MVGDEVMFLEKIKITDILKLMEVLENIWLDAAKRDYKKMSREDLYKKYDLQMPDDLVEFLLDDTKAEEYKKWLDSLKKKPKYID